MSTGVQAVKYLNRAVLIVLAVALAMGGCHLRPSAPETRAIYFLDKMIREPAAIEDLRAVMWLADDQLPDSVMADLPTRTSIRYLRARHRQGASIDLSGTIRSSPAPDRRSVRVTVREAGAGKLVEPVQLDVELEKRNDEWRVTRLRTD